MSSDMPGGVANETERRTLVNRIRRLTGQARGVRAMIDKGGECEPVLTQILAARSALGQLGLHIIGYAMKRCLSADDGASRDSLLDESFGVFLHYRELAAPSISKARETPRTAAELASRLDEFCLQLVEVESLLVSGGSCERLVTDIGRATGILNEVGLGVLSHAMQACLVPEDGDREAVIDSAISVFLKYSACLR